MAVKVREKPKCSGIYWVFINHKGQRKAKKIGKDKRVALEVARKIEAKLVLGDAGVFKQEHDNSPTFGDYADIWINITVPATCKPSTANDYRGLLKNHILPVFGNEAISNVKKFMIKTFLMEKIKKGYAPSTVTHIKNAISGVMGLAVDDEAIDVNPAQNMGKLFKNERVSKLMAPLSRRELSLLLTTFNKHYSRHYPLTLTLARTGMRFGEALALQWGDIDFNGRFITVERGFSKGKIETPKNGKSRKVDMSRQLTKEFFNLKIQRKKETLRKGWKEMPVWVFITEKGTPLNDSNWRRRVYYKALEKAGLRKIRIHDLRHTYASLLIQAGESLAYIRDQLGHHSIKVTVDIYGHLAPEGNKAAVDGLDDMEEDATIRNLSATK